MVTGGAPETDRTTFAPPMSERFRLNARDFPYWFVAILGILGWMGYLILSDDRYGVAWDRIIPGIWTTISATFFGFLFALVIGLFAGLGRISRNVVARNVAITYIEFIRGVPILVLIFTVALSLIHI